MSGRLFARAAGVLVCVVLLVSGCGVVPRSQTPQEALGLPQAETPFAQRESIEEYLRAVEPVMARFVHALAEKEGVIGVDDRRYFNACTDRGPGREEGWAFGTERLFISSLTDKDIEDAASQYLSVLPSYKGTRGTVQKDGSFILRSGDVANGGGASGELFPQSAVLHALRVGVPSVGWVDGGPERVRPAHGRGCLPRYGGLPGVRQGHQEAEHAPAAPKRLGPVRAVGSACPVRRFR